MTELEGKFAIITGAGSGMARAFDEGFCPRGRPSARRRHQRTPGGDSRRTWRCCRAVSLRCHQGRSVEAMFAAAVGAFGRIDAVLNVAGIGSAGELAEVSMDEYDRIMDADLRSVMLGTKHGIRAMLPTGGGVILNWSSTGGMNATPFPVSVYSARQGWRHCAHQGCGRRIRHQGYSGHCHLPRLHRDRDVWRTRCGGPASPARAGHCTQARWPTRGGG